MIGVVEEERGQRADNATGDESIRGRQAPRTKHPAADMIKANASAYGARKPGSL